MSVRPCEELVSEVLDTLFDGAILLAGDPVRAETLVVTTTAGACGDYAVYHDGVDFDTWLISRMVRQWIGLHTEHPGDRRLTDYGPERADQLEEVLLELARLEVTAPDSLSEMVRGAMTELPLSRRAVLWMVNVAGFSYTEAARAMKSSRPATAETLFAARRSLQFLLATALRRRGQTDVGAA